LGAGLTLRTVPDTDLAVESGEKVYNVIDTENELDVRKKEETDVEIKEGKISIRNLSHQF
jgi:hypothetical protein